MYIINQDSKIPLHIQLYEEIKKDIIENLNIGDKLSSIRKVASTYNLSKNTVESAYSQLYAEGYIDSYPKSGYFISEINYKDFKPKIEISNTPIKTPIKYKYDFFPARLEQDSFPLKLWKRLYIKATDENLDFGAYPKGQGEVELRVEIAKYLNSSRGTNCHPNQIIITSGFGESMNLLAKMIQKDYDSFAMENPGYHIALKVFKEYGYKIDKIGIDKNGLKIEELIQSDSKLVYITPSHQYPKGVSMPISNRLKLLEWADNKKGFILEDDYDSELTYYTRPIPSLQGLDRYDRVVYFGTFAKILSPALRVGYMVLPNRLLDEYEKHFDIHFCKVSLSIQKTLALFIKMGYFEKHIRKMRTLNKKKHELLKKQLKLKLGNTFKIEADGAGLAIVINPIVPLDIDKLKDLAQKSSIKLYFTKNVSGGEWEAIRVGFGGFKEQELIKAVDAFAKIWKKSLI